MSRGAGHLTWSGKVIPCRVIGTLGRLLTILSLCLSIGLQWVALQSVAWTTMLIEHARHESLAQAVAKTFDGKHPCSLCERISKSQDPHKKTQFQTTTGKVDLFCTRRAVYITPAFRTLSFENDFVDVPNRWDIPPVPPPRLPA